MVRLDYPSLRSLMERDLQFFNWDRDVQFCENSADSSGSSSIRVKVYTETNCYTITTIVSEGKSYLGCVAWSRKPRAGEDDGRGNDLPDGEYTEETWYRIVGAIVGYELVKIHRKEIQHCES